MQIIKRALIIRLIMSMAIIMIVLLINLSSNTMIFLLILAVLLTLLDTILDLYESIKLKKFDLDKILIILSILIAFCASYEFEAVIFSVLYKLSEYIIGILQMKTSDNLKISIINDDISGLLNKVLTYRSATTSRSEKILKSSVTPILYLIIIIDFILLIVLPIFAHYNLRVTLHRFSQILYLASSYPIFISFKTIGTHALCSAANNGVLFNSAENLELLDENGIIYNSEEKSFRNDIFIEINTSIDKDTFSNIVAHVISRSSLEFALKIKENLSFPINDDLISNSYEYEDCGISCTINNMDVFFGNYLYLDKIGLITGDKSKNNYYLYMGNRQIGCISVLESNVSDNSADELILIAERVGKVSQINSVFAFTIKSILISLSIIGVLKLWIIIIVELISEILEIINAYRI